MIAATSNRSSNSNSNCNRNAQLILIPLVAYHDDTFSLFISMYINRIIKKKKENQNKNLLISRNPWMCLESESREMRHNYLLSSNYSLLYINSKYLFKSKWSLFYRIKMFRSFHLISDVEISLICLIDCGAIVSLLRQF